MCCGRARSPQFTRVCIPGKSVRAVVFRSKAGVVLGTSSQLGCAPNFGLFDQRIRLRKRTCFRMTGGGVHPFAMRASKVSVGMLKAGFGMGTCASRSSVAAALGRNRIQMDSVQKRDLRLFPKRRVVCRGGGKAVRGHSLRGISSCSN